MYIHLGFIVTLHAFSWQHAEIEVPVLLEFPKN
jgi:hypothetical protein